MERPGCDDAETVTLSRDFYRADRSMRESGFDVSFRFGPHGAATHHYAPVCLNSLLYKTRKDLAEMARMLGKQSESATWARASRSRKKQIQKYLWDANSGLFFDYNLDKKERSKLHLHHGVLPAVGRCRYERTGRGVGKEPFETRTTRRPRHEPLRNRRPMGFSLCLGANANHRARRLAQIRLQHRRRPHLLQFSSA